MKINRFEDLNIWKLALKLTRNIYDLTSKKEFNHDFELKNQIKGAAISISSNINKYILIKERRIKYDTFNHWVIKLVPI